MKSVFKKNTTQLLLVVSMFLALAFGSMSSSAGEIGTLVSGGFDLSNMSMAALPLIGLNVFAPFPVTAEYTGITLAYKNLKLIADRVLPRVPVSVQSFKYLKFPKGSLFSVPETKVGRKGQPNQVEFEAEEVTDSTVDHALDDAVPAVDIMNAQQQQGIPDPRARATEGLTDLILLAREVRTAGVVFNPANYGANNKETLAAGTQWSHVDSDPIRDIAEAMEAAVMPYNILTLGSSVSLALRRHPKIIKAYNGTLGDSGIVPLEFLRQLFELDEILVGVGRVNTAKKGQAANLTRVWGNHALLAHRNENADTRNGTTFGFTAQFGGRVAGSQYDGKIGMRGGEIVRVGESVKELITANDLGHLFIDAAA